MTKNAWRLSTWLMQRFWIRGRPVRDRPIFGKCWETFIGTLQKYTILARDTLKLQLKQVTHMLKLWQSSFTLALLSSWAAFLIRVLWSLILGRIRQTRSKIVRGLYLIVKIKSIDKTHQMKFNNKRDRLVYDKRSSTGDRSDGESFSNLCLIMSPCLIVSS